MDSKSGYPDLSGSAPPPSGFGPPPPYPMDNHHPMSHHHPPPGMQYAPVAPGPQIIAPPPSFGAYPQNAFCAHCNQIVSTRTDFKVGVLTWLASAGCCLIGCFAGCCLIPCCTDFTRDVEHACTKCGRRLGIYKRL